MEYYKELLKETKQKQLEEEELIKKIKELEKQAGKLRVKGTLYSLFGNTELDKAEKRVGELEREMEQQRFLSEKENAEIRITTNEKRQPILTINGLSVSDWCEQKW